MSVLSILVIDDDAEFLETISGILRSHGWNVDIAQDGFKATDMVQANNYDVVFLDINMPGIDGVETFKRIKEIKPGTIVFMITGTDTANLVDMLKKGVSAVMQKPIDYGRIIKMVDDFEKNRKNETILIVDDNEEDRVLLTDIFKSKGYNISSAKDGMNAIKLIRENKFDVILLDMRLPDIDGVSVMEKIKQYSPASGVIAITGYSLDGVIEKIIGMGAYTCLLKPFDIEMLINDVNYLVKHSSSKDQTKEELQKILIVEDNEDISESMKEILQSENFVIETANSVPQAEEKINNSVYDMVISDLSLKGKSGMLLVDCVRRKNKFTSFILMTGYGSMETAMEAVRKDIDEYILKPIKPHDLVNKVKTYLEKQKLNREKEKLVLKLQESNIKLMELSKTDELTNVSNRRYFFEQLHIEMQRAKRQNDVLCLMMCDIDGFKVYNDTFGHIEGDKILKDIASIILATVRTYVDQVFRYGGDEFSVIVPSISNENSIKLAKRIIDKINENFKEMKVGMSIGISCFCKNNYDLTLNELINLADKKLYEAKKLGGGKAVL